MFLILSKKKNKDVISVPKPPNPTLNMTSHDTSSSTLKSQMAYIPATGTNVADKKKTSKTKNQNKQKRKPTPRHTFLHCASLRVVQECIASYKEPKAKYRP